MHSNMARNILVDTSAIYMSAQGGSRLSLVDWPVVVSAAETR